MMEARHSMANHGQSETKTIINMFNPNAIESRRKELEKSIPTGCVEQ